jgi:hypothetical protein
MLPIATEPKPAGWPLTAAQFTPRHAGQWVLKVKAVNDNGVAQPDTPNWNAGGYMRNVVESATVVVA